MFEGVCKVAHIHSTGAGISAHVAEMAGKSMSQDVSLGVAYVACAPRADDAGGEDDREE